MEGSNQRRRFLFVPFHPAAVSLDFELVTSRQSSLRDTRGFLTFLDECCTHVDVVRPPSRLDCFEDRHHYFVEMWPTRSLDLQRQEGMVLGLWNWGRGLGKWGCPRMEQP